MLRCKIHQLFLYHLQNIATCTIRKNVSLATTRIELRHTTQRNTLYSAIIVRWYDYRMRWWKGAKQRTSTKGRNFGRFFLIFTDTIRHCSQHINKYFTKSSSTYIKQTPRFLFRFLKINLKRKTSYHDLYRDIRVNANSPRLMTKPRENDSRDYS